MILGFKELRDMKYKKNLNDNYSKIVKDSKNWNPTYLNDIDFDWNSMINGDLKECKKKVEEFFSKIL